jgi:hypothetical protein
VLFAARRKDRLIYTTNEPAMVEDRRIQLPLGSSNLLTRRRATAFTIPRIAVAFPVLFAFGCTLARQQAEEANARAARVGHPEVRYQEELSPGLALTLGFLPFGAAGFYVHSTRLAASGLLWPFSMLWLPNMAYDAAIEVNDRAFERRLMDALQHESQSK